MNHRQVRPVIGAAMLALGGAAWGALLLVACARPESASPAPAATALGATAPATTPAAPAPSLAPSSPAPTQTAPSPRPPAAPLATPGTTQSAPTPAPAPTLAPTLAPTPAPIAAGSPSPAAPAASAPGVVDPGGPVAVAAPKPGPTRVGVQKCGICHKRQRESWAASAHARRTPPLDCESCHGAGSEYVSMAVMKDAQKARAAGLVLPPAAFCQTCHQHGWQADLLQRAHAHKAPAVP